MSGQRSTANHITPPFFGRVWASLAVAFCLSWLPTPGAAQAQPAPAVMQAGGLLWLNPVIEEEAAPGQTSSRAVFRFRNEGPRPVTIVRMQTDCGCSTAGLKQHSFATGEGGEVDLVFEYGSRLGRHTRVLQVHTDAATRPVTLTLQVDIPEAVRLRPSFLFWQRNTPAEPRTSEVHILLPELFEEVSVHSLDPRFSHELIFDQEDPSLLRLVVTPQTTSESLRGGFIIHVSLKDVPPIQLRVYAAVR